MTLWQALAVEVDQAHTLWLIVGFAATALIARLLSPHERRRLGTLAFLVSVHGMLVVAGAILREAGDKTIRDIRLFALILGAFAGIAMVSSVIGALMNRTRVRLPTIVRDVFAGAAAIVAVFIIASRMGVAVSRASSRLRRSSPTSSASRFRTRSPT